MANLFSTNNYRPYGSGYSNSTTAGFTDQMFYDWKIFMVSAGWTVIASGDGISAMSLTGDVFTHPYTGANGFANQKSWFIIKEPGTGYAGSVRQFMVVKNVQNTGSERFVIYSQQGFNLTTATGNGHNNANTTAANPPIAFDEIVIGGYDSYALYTTVTTNGIFNYDIVNQTAAFYGQIYGGNIWNGVGWQDPTNDVNYPGLYYSFYTSDTAPYSFYIIVSAANVSASTGYFKGVKILTSLVFDELLEYPTNHPDPAIITKINQKHNGWSLCEGTYADYTTNNSFSGFFSNMWESKSLFTSKADAITKMSVNFTDNYVPVRVIDVSTGLTTPPVSDQSRKDTIMPVVYFSAGNSSLMYAGKSSVLKILNQNKDALMTVKVNSSRDNIVITNDGGGGISPGSSWALIAPWDGSAIRY